MIETLWRKFHCKWQYMMHTCVVDRKIFKHYARQKEKLTLKIILIWMWLRYWNSVEPSSTNAQTELDHYVPHNLERWKLKRYILNFDVVDTQFWQGKGVLSTWNATSLDYSQFYLLYSRRTVKSKFPWIYNTRRAKNAIYISESAQFLQSVVRYLANIIFSFETTRTWSARVWRLEWKQ